jgi:hypothetical protein
MNTDTPPMKTITWKELWPKQKLIAAEKAHSLAAEALTQAERALCRIDVDPSARCVAIQEEIEEISKDYWTKEGIEEGHWGRVRNTTEEERDQIDSRREQLEQALSHAATEHENTRPARLAALEKKTARRKDALVEARHELDSVKTRVEMASNYNAPGPIHVYGTLSEAIWAICPVHIESNQLGETYAQVEGARIRITGNASLTTIPPTSLSWVPKSSQHPEAATPALEIFAHIVYIEDADRILIREKPNAQVQASHQLSGQAAAYARAFGSLEDALRHYVDELRALESIDISDGKPLPLLGEVVRDACRKTAADTVGDPKFLPGQRRLSDGQIYKLVGTCWRVFLDAPWEESTEGSYALLKYLCTRDETPSFFSYGTHGHFGFRVLTPEHEWITGEIYCPPEYLSPTEGPELEVINRPLGKDWLAELGPVKFLIRGKRSRS